MNSSIRVIRRVHETVSLEVGTVAYDGTHGIQLKDWNIAVTRALNLFREVHGREPVFDDDMVIMLMDEHIAITFRVPTKEEAL